MKKRIFSIIICLFLLFGLTACSGGSYTPSQKPFDEKVSSSVLSEGEVIAQNDKFSMEYDAETGSVRLVDIASGTKWDVCPSSSGEVQYDSFGLPIKDHVFVQSAIEVGYIDPDVRGGGNTVATSYDGSVSGGRTVVKKIENGVTVEYYFDGQKFMVPVDYLLKDNYLSISVDSSKIQEDRLRITYVSIAPFMNSVENDTANSYLFIPSGSGALTNVKSYSAQGLNYSAFVYGDDYTMEDKYITTQEQSIRMPVYGYKSGEKGGFTIIDSGAETATLKCTVGNTSYKFSAVYPTFQLRGYTNHEARAFKSTYYANIYPENMIENVFSVRFYPLSGDKANYSAMADIYRDYLVKEKGLKEGGDEKSLNVNLIGGTQIKKSFLGIPYDTVYATTTVKQANEIIEELSGSVKNLSVQLKGFGSSGIDLGEIGGGFDVNGNIGSVSEVKKLSSLCGDKGVDLYFDYDLVRFNSSGGGFSYYGDAVMNSGIIKAQQYIPDKANHQNAEAQVYRLLRPINFADAISKALKRNSKMNVGGISLDTLTSFVYSDYSNYHSTVDFNARNGYSAAVTDALKQVSESKQKLMASDANDFTAVAADLIVDAPVSSDKGYAFVEDVPFYAMVFKGYVPMTCGSVNLTANPQKTLLGAVEGGMGLNYTVINQWDNKLIDAVYPYFYSTVYSSVKNDILAAYDSLAEYYNSINKAKIVSNTLVSSGVHCTVFDNGVTVYVNYNNAPAQSPAGEIAALNYIVTGGAAQ